MLRTKISVRIRQEQNEKLLMLCPNSDIAQVHAAKVLKVAHHFVSQWSVDDPAHNIGF